MLNNNHKNKWKPNISPWKRLVVLIAFVGITSSSTSTSTRKTSSSTTSSTTSNSNSNSNPSFYFCLAFNSNSIPTSISTSRSAAALNGNALNSNRLNRLNGNGLDRRSYQILSSTSTTSSSSSLSSFSSSVSSLPSSKSNTNINININAITSSKRRRSQELLSSATLSNNEEDNSHNNNNNNNSNTNTNVDKKIRRSIYAILTATTLNLLGFTMTSPLTPTLGTHFDLPTGASFGSLTSAYPMGMLFGLFIWPKLSDNKHVGRKKVMVISLLGSAVGLMAQSLCIFRTTAITTTTTAAATAGGTAGIGNMSLLFFLGCRVLTGVFSGSAPVAKAFLADVGDRDGQLAMYLGWRDAAATLAYILGPVCGGILFECLRKLGSSTASSTSSIGTLASSVAGMKLVNGGASAGSSAATGILAFDKRSQALGYVIGISALGSFIAAMLILSFVDDKIGSSSSKSRNKSTQVKGDNDENSDNNVKTTTTATNTKEEDNYEIIACPLGTKLWTGVGTVCVISFLYHVADSTFFAFFPALLQNQLNLNPQQIGLVFTMLSCITFSFSATSMSSRLIKKIGVVNTCALGLSAVGAGLCCLSASASIAATATAAVATLPLLIIGSAGLYFCGVPLYGPTIPTMLLQCVPPYQRGAVMGIDGIINTIARILSPILMGDIYRRLGASMAFGVAGLAVLSSSAIALIRRFIVLRDQKKNF